MTRGRLMAGTFAVAAMGMVAGGATAATKPVPGEFSGSAGTVRVTVPVGATGVHGSIGARESCPCDSIGGTPRTDTTAAVALEGVATIASSTASTATGRGTASAYARQSDTVTGVDLLGGLVTVGSLTVVASASGTPDATTASTAGTSFTGLVVAGKAVDPATAPGTVLDLPGVGSVTVLDAHERHDGRTSKASVTGLRVDVTLANALGLPVGGVVTVGQASAGFDRTQPAARLEGRAVGVQANGEGSSLRALTSVSIPGCSGTDGRTLTKQTAALDVARLVTVAASTSTAFGGAQGTSQVARTGTKLTGVSLLGGLVTVSALDAEATETRTGNVSTGSTAGTTFAGLTVAGVTLPPLVAPNTEIPLLGLGTVKLNVQEIGTATTKVDGIEVLVTTPNLLGLPVGEKVIVGEAVATAARFH